MAERETWRRAVLEVAFRAQQARGRIDQARLAECKAGLEAQQQ